MRVLRRPRRRPHCGFLSLSNIRISSASPPASQTPTSLRLRAARVRRPVRRQSSGVPDAGLIAADPRCGCSRVRGRVLRRPRRRPHCGPGTTFSSVYTCPGPPASQTPASLRQRVARGQTGSQDRPPASQTPASLRRLPQQGLGPPLHSPPASQTPASLRHRVHLPLPPHAVGSSGVPDAGLIAACPPWGPRWRAGSSSGVPDAGLIAATC